MDFVSAVILLFVFYVRPQEWISVFSAARPLLVAQGFALFALLIRPGRIQPRDFFKTPHDWMMLIYWAWIVWTSAESWETFKNLTPLFLIYLFIVQALSTTRRLMFFFYWWSGFIFLIACLAVASEYGFDPTGSYEMTHGWAKGRLIFNTSMFDNPNALGHSVAPVIPLIYFLLVWKRPIFVIEAAIPLMVPPLICVYLTQSKGSYISGFVAIIAALAFGRPKFVQAIILTLAVTVGWGAMYSLPRFTEISKSRSDEALLGRLMSLEFGLRKMETTSTGVGWLKYIPAYQREDPDHAIASHNAYNEIGAELGYTGLFLFVGILYCCMRSTITANTSNIDEERIRRILFMLVASFAVSAWVIDFAYRATFFMIVAAVAAFHRTLQEKNPVEKPPESEDFSSFRAVRSGAGGMLRPTPVEAAATPVGASANLPPRQLLMPKRPYAVGGGPTGPEKPPILMAWRRLGILDLILMYIITEQVIQLWKYIIKNF